MSPQTSPICGVFTADPIHSSVGFARKCMGVSTFRATFDRLSATLAGGRDGVELVGGADVESVSIHAILATIGAEVIEGELPVGQAHKAFDDDGRFGDPGLRASLSEAVAALTDHPRAPAAESAAC